MKLNKCKSVDLKSASGITQDLQNKLTIVIRFLIAVLLIYSLYFFIFKNDVKRIQQNRDPVLSGIYNKAHAMRYDLEDQHQKRLREFVA